MENKSKGFIYHIVFGFRNEEKTVLAKISFKTASVSKTFTAAVIMQMAEEGKFNLSESISRYKGDNSFVNFDKFHLLNGTS